MTISLVVFLACILASFYLQEIAALKLEVVDHSIYTKRKELRISRSQNDLAGTTVFVFFNDVAYYGPQDDQSVNGVKVSVHSPSDCIDFRNEYSVPETNVVYPTLNSYATSSVFYSVAELTKSKYELNCMSIYIETTTTATVQSIFPILASRYGEYPDHSLTLVTKEATAPLTPTTSQSLISSFTLQPIFGRDNLVFQSSHSIYGNSDCDALTRTCDVQFNFKVAFGATNTEQIASGNESLYEKMGVIMQYPNLNWNLYNCNQKTDDTDTQVPDFTTNASNFYFTLPYLFDNKVSNVYAAEYTTEFSFICAIQWTGAPGANWNTETNSVLHPSKTVIDFSLFFNNEPTSKEINYKHSQFLSSFEVTSTVDQMANGLISLGKTDNIYRMTFTPLMSFPVIHISPNQCGGSKINLVNPNPNDSVPAANCGVSNDNQLICDFETTDFNFLHHITFTISSFTDCKLLYQPPGGQYNFELLTLPSLSKEKLYKSIFSQSPFDLSKKSYLVKTPVNGGMDKSETIEVNKFIKFYHVTKTPVNTKLYYSITPTIDAPNAGKVQNSGNYEGEEMKVQSTDNLSLKNVNYHLTNCPFFTVDPTKLHAESLYLIPREPVGDNLPKIEGIYECEIELVYNTILAQNIGHKVQMSYLEKSFDPIYSLDTYVPVPYFNVYSSTYVDPPQSNNSVYSVKSEQSSTVGNLGKISSFITNVKSTNSDVLKVDTKLSFVLLPVYETPSIDIMANFHLVGSYVKNCDASLNISEQILIISKKKNQLLLSQVPVNLVNNVDSKLISISLVCDLLYTENIVKDEDSVVEVTLDAMDKPYSSLFVLPAGSVTDISTIDSHVHIKSPSSLTPDEIEEILNQYKDKTKDVLGGSGDSTIKNIEETRNNNDVDTDITISIGNEDDGIDLDVIEDINDSFKESLEEKSNGKWKVTVSPPEHSVISKSCREKCGKECLCALDKPCTTNSDCLSGSCKRPSETKSKSAFTLSDFLSENGDVVENGVCVPPEDKDEDNSGYNMSLHMLVSILSISFIFMMVM